jgi:hypothetical protein
VQESVVIHGRAIDRDWYLIVAVEFPGDIGLSD